MVEYVAGALHRLNAQQGQTLAEYSLILAFVFAACVIALGALGLALAGEIDSFAGAFPGG